MSILLLTLLFSLPDLMVDVQACSNTKIPVKVVPRREWELFGPAGYAKINLKPPTDDATS